MSKSKVPASIAGIEFNLDNAVKAKNTYRALLHPMRKKILNMLDSAKDKSLNVTTIYTRLKVDQPLASLQLGTLKRAGLVKADRRGKEIYYSVDYQALKTINKISELLG